MEFIIEKVSFEDLPEILELQKAAFYPVSVIAGDGEIQPLKQSYESIIEEWENGIVLKALSGNTITGSVRAYSDENDICHIGKLVVHPDYQNKGLGSQLMHAIEICFDTCSIYRLFTGLVTPNTYHLYSKLGYREINRGNMHGVDMVFMKKINKRGLGCP